MSVLRLYTTDPLHPPVLFTSCFTISFSIYTRLFQVFVPCGICIVNWKIVHLSFTHALFQNYKLQRIVDSLHFRSHFLHVVPIGTKYITFAPAHFEIQEIITCRAILYFERRQMIRTRKQENRQTSKQTNTGSLLS